MKKKMILSSFLLSSILFLYPLTSYAEELEDTSQSIVETETFENKEDAEEWIEENTKDETKDYETAIEENTVSGVTVEQVDEEGYHTEEVYDEYDYKKDPPNQSGETIVITGGLEEIKIEPDGFEYSAQPGDTGTITYTFENVSGDTYEISSVEHNESTISQYDRNGIIDFNSTLLIGYLNKFDPTVKDIWNEDKLDLKIDSTNIKTVITEERLLKYYNTINGTNFEKLEDAWKYNFFNRCWNLTYSKDLSEIDVNNGDTLVIDWEISGPLTDNAYQNTVWSWGDVINIICPEKTEYNASIISTDKKEPEEEPKEDSEEKPKPDPNPKEKENKQQKEAKVYTKNTVKITNTPKTGDLNNIALYSAMMLFSIFILFIVFIVNKKSKL